MEITFDLPDSTIRRIKALGVLRGSDNLESVVSHLIETSVSQHIIDLLVDANPNLKAKPANDGFSVSHVPDGLPTATTSGSSTEDVTGISDGLGDEYDYQQEETEDDDDVEAGKPVEDMNDLIPQSGGLTEDTILKDLDVEDPEHEVAMDAGTSAPSETLNHSPAENLFSDLAGLPRLEPTPTANRKRRQARSKPHRAKISPMMD